MADPTDTDPALQQLKRKHEAALAHLTQVKTQTNDKGIQGQAQKDADEAGRNFTNAWNKKKKPEPHTAAAGDLLRSWAGGSGPLAGQ